MSLAARAQGLVVLSLALMTGAKSCNQRVSPVSSPSCSALRMQAAMLLMIQWAQPARRVTAAAYGGAAACAERSGSTQHVQHQIVLGGAHPGGG